MAALTATAIFLGLNSPLLFVFICPICPLAPFPPCSVFFKIECAYGFIAFMSLSAIILSFALSGVTLWFIRAPSVSLHLHPSELPGPRGSHGSRTGASLRPAHPRPSFPALPALHLHAHCKRLQHSIFYCFAETLDSHSYCCRQRWTSSWHWTLLLEGRL